MEFNQEVTVLESVLERFSFATINKKLVEDFQANFPK